MPRFTVTSATHKWTGRANSKEEAEQFARRRGLIGLLKIRKCPVQIKPAARFNDGGLRGSGIPVYEKNDCTVRALAIALQIEYMSAHRLLEVYGRKVRHGFHFSTWARSIGCHMLKRLEQYDPKYNTSAEREATKYLPKWSAVTVGQFLKANPRGVYRTTSSLL